MLWNEVCEVGVSVSECWCWDGCWYECRCGFGCAGVLMWVGHGRIRWVRDF